MLGMQSYRIVQQFTAKKKRISLSELLKLLYVHDATLFHNNNIINYALCLLSYFNVVVMS